VNIGNMEDFYKILQVHADAEDDMIQNAYRRLCKKYHPDLNRTPMAADAMVRINRAYETLGNPSQRRRYHEEWLRKRPVLTAPFSSRAAGTPEAVKAITDYFTLLSQGNLRGAYELISLADRGNFTYETYDEWQSAVGAIYEIGSFRIELFKKTPSFRLTGKTPTPAEEYTVIIVEKNRTTSEISEYSFVKMAVYEKGAWRVYLGYRSLTPLLLQFKSQAETLEEARLLTHWNRYRETTNLTLGLPNLQGLLRQMEPDIYRYTRYKRPFTLALIETALPRCMEDERMQNAVKTFAANLLREELRVIDTLGVLDGEGRILAAVLAETDKKSGAKALARLSKALARGVGSCFDVTPILRTGIAVYAGQGAEGLVEAAKREMK
jgi:curved DNA-binding protein CbpA